MMTNIQGAGSILEQMRALKLESSGLEIRNDTNKVAQADFGQFLQNALDGVNSRMVESDNLKERFELGDESISLSDVMISSQKASLAFEATVQIRNKCIDAYKTIMQMQV
jgi:flagellar hook-basal body complex protein FliE